MPRGADPRHEAGNAEQPRRAGEIDAAGVRDRDAAARDATPDTPSRTTSAGNTPRVSLASPGRDGGAPLPARRGPRAPAARDRQKNSACSWPSSELPRRPSVRIEAADPLDERAAAPPCSRRAARGRRSSKTNGSSDRSRESPACPRGPIAADRSHDGHGALPTTGAPARRCRRSTDPRAVGRHDASSHSVADLRTSSSVNTMSAASVAARPVLRAFDLP